MLFGSYFGDWDANNSFLRAPLATGMGLTSVWSGRPHYQFHHMGLGENIGYGLLMTQNNPAGLYFASPTGITGKWIHNALMGDPTLRNDVVSPVSNIVATKVGYDCNISWSASTQTNVIGYHLYVKNDSNTHYQRLNQLPIAGTTYTDLCLLYKGIYTYMVRAIVLENTNSGSYYNLSEGIADTAYNSSTIKTYALFTSTLSGATLSLTNTSINGTSVSWNFGGGQISSSNNPVQTFTSNGSYSVTMISYNACHSDTAYEEFTIEEVGLRKLYDEKSFDIFPNPSEGSVTLISSQAREYTVIISDAKGQVVLKNQIKDQHVEINLRALKSGIYFVQLLTDQAVFFKKLVLN